MSCTHTNVSNPVRERIFDNASKKVLVVDIKTCLDCGARRRFPIRKDVFTDYCGLSFINPNCFGVILDNSDRCTNCTTNVIEDTFTDSKGKTSKRYKLR